MNNVTLVVTSCGRMDLLDQTLESLFETDWSEFEYKIIIEDSGDQKNKDYIEHKYGHKFDLILFNEKNIGKLKSIDKAYSFVKSKYIFHCEDDWFFHRKGFLNDSVEILESDKNISTVNLRSYYWDLKTYSKYVVSARRSVKCVHYYVIEDNSKMPMNGFSLNPGLRRKSDILDLGELSNIGAEYLLSSAFLKKGMHMVILENSAIAHLGWGRGLEDPGKQSLIFKKLKNLIKSFLNIFGGNYHLHN